MILFGSSFSPFVRKVMVYLAEKGIDYELRNVGLGSEDAEFLMASPFRKMPALTDGAYSVADSSAIIAYLEAKYPQNPLMPADAQGRGKATWFDEMGDTIMSGVVFKCFFNRIVAPLFLKQPGDEALAVEGETKDLPLILDYLEGVVPEPGAPIVGDAFGVADISVASFFVNYDHARCAVDKAKWPRTYAWVDAVHARPSFAAIIAKERKILGR